MDIKKYLFCFLILLMSVLTLDAQDAVGRKQEKMIVEQVTENYKNWGRASWSGKLSADILPVSATLKVFMERNKLTLISVRAPFLGEVARIEVDKDSVLIVNKFKKRYYSRPIAEISQMVPDLTEDLQSLLLGRMFVVGSGQLDKGDADKVNVFPTASEDCYMIVPDVPEYLPEVLYGFATDPHNRMATFVCAYGRADSSTDTGEIDADSQYEPEVQVQADITYRSKGVTAYLQALFRSKSYNAAITADEIEWGGKGFDRINIEGYARVSFKDVMKIR